MQSADKLVTSGLLSCTAGKFQWVFSWDEFVHVLDGEVIISEEGCETYILNPGDFAHFPVFRASARLAAAHAALIETRAERRVPHPAFSGEIPQRTQTDRQRRRALHQYLWMNS